ncbi:MAG: hypothetical protein NC337_04600 [Roseburia sp.]|nr:hypothetical protein [Roseburia sp.]
MTNVQRIKECIEECIGKGKEIIICPFGEIGILVKQILYDCYGIKETHILDNHLCKYNSKIKPVSYLNNLNEEKYVVILACLEENVRQELEKMIESFSPKMLIKKISEELPPPAFSNKKRKI